MFRRKKNNSPYEPKRKRKDILVEPELIPDPKPKDNSFEEDEFAKKENAEKDREQEALKRMSDKEFVGSQKKELRRTEKILEDRKRGAILTVKDFFNKYLKNKKKEEEEPDEKE